MASTVSLQLVIQHMTNPPARSNMLLRVDESTLCIGEVIADVSIDRREVSSPVVTLSKKVMSWTTMDLNRLGREEEQNKGKEKKESQLPAVDTRVSRGVRTRAVVVGSLTDFSHRLQYGFPQY